jgi:hypothetical protein
VRDAGGSSCGGSHRAAVGIGAPPDGNGPDKWRVVPRHALCRWGDSPLIESRSRRGGYEDVVLVVG